MITRQSLTTAAIIVALMLAILPASAFAHDGKHPDAPNPSPMASTSQEVGYTNVEVKFGRPGVKGREVWGTLVPYSNEKAWVAGANGSTTITFSEAVKVNGEDLEAGSYGLHMMVGENEWTVIFNSDSSRFGIMKYKGETDALRLTVTPKKAEFQEWLNYEIVKTGDLTADLNLSWENIKVGFSIEGPDHRKGEGNH